MPRKIKSDFYHKQPTDLLIQKRIYKKDDMRDAQKIYRLLHYLLSTKKSYPDHSDFRGFSNVSRQQKCVVKMRYGSDVAKHMRFLSFYLPQENKSEILEKPEIFSEIPVDSDFIKDYTDIMSAKHFKFIVSPANQTVDTQALVRTLMKRMEKITGFKFSWVSSVHTNTEHKHAHILINGVDKNGLDINCFTGVFLKQTIREMSRQICTEMIGQRTMADIKLDASKLITAPNYNKLDEGIEGAQKPLQITEINDHYFESEVYARNVVMQQRLSYLVDLGFAKRKEAMQKTYLLEKDWSKKLKAIGRYNSFLSARNEMLLTDTANLELYGNDSGEITGIITKLYKMNDEDSWNNAILVENRGLKKAWYIPLYKESNDKLLGTTIRCAVEKNQKGLLSPKITVLHWNIKR